MWGWFAGAMVLATHLGWSLIRLRRALRRTVAVTDPAALELLDRCRAHMGVHRQLVLLETMAVATPALCGLLRPRLLLPPGLIAQFGERELRFVFLHELAHLKRHDIMANWLTTLLQLLHWFNPLVWLAFARMRSDRELACDALVLAQAQADESRAYGQTIIRLLEGFSRPAALPGVVGILEDHGQMKRRITMIANHSRVRRSTLLALVLLPALAVVALTDARTEKGAASGNGGKTTSAPDTMERQSPPAGTGVVSSGPTSAVTSGVQGDGNFDVEILLSALSASENSTQATPSPPSALPAAPNGLTNAPKSAAVTPTVGDTNGLQVRVFKVDPNAMRQGSADLQGRRPAGLPTNWAVSLVDQGDLVSSNRDLVTKFRNAATIARFDKLKEVLASMGVDLSPPKAIFFNERLGTLMVKATLSDLDTIEKAVQVLNASPPQVTIRARFVEVREDEPEGKQFMKALGFETGAAKPVQTTNRLPSQAASAAARTNLPSAPFTGVLTPPQFRSVLALLAASNGVELLSMPEITTLSGRQAQLKSVDVRYVVTDLGTDKKNGTVSPMTEPFEIGPVLDVVPYVCADGYTIQMAVIPMVQEFLGYDDPGSLVKETPAAPRTPTPLPKFRLRQVTTSATVWDGQTLVLSPGTVEETQTIRHIIPGLGSLPATRRVLQSSATTSTNRRSLFIFITPTIIDPAGNPVHRPEDVPFRDHAVPSQKPMAPSGSSGDRQNPPGNKTTRDG